MFRGASSAASVSLYAVLDRWARCYSEERVARCAHNVRLLWRQRTPLQSRLSTAQLKGRSGLKVLLVTHRHPGGFTVIE